MDRNNRGFFKKLSNNQFKRKGADHRERRNQSLGHEQSIGKSRPGDTIYRILCPSRKIGSVLGKGGSIVKALREETQAKITVSETVPGSDEREILIYSSPSKLTNKQAEDEDLAADSKPEHMEPHCAAQDALLKVHDRIVKEDIFGGIESDDESENSVVMARLLVPNNMVGCVLGKGGDVIQRLRSETGASIRVLPAEHLPPNAKSSDELVQISGKPDTAKRALYVVSTLLHQNPRKDKPPLDLPMPYGAGRGPHPPVPPMANFLPPGNPRWSPRSSSSHRLPPMQWIEEFRDPPSRVGPGAFDGFPPRHGREGLGEFSLKILCPAAKIGGVIGKGGSVVRQLQQETGTSIQVDDPSPDSNERVIHVSAFESGLDTRSQTIDAILHLQHLTSEGLEKGVITTRILVPSKKVGCILGQGGNVINEMRWRTKADIRVYPKEEKPSCASKEEELIQISGSFGVAREALAEIASRLRARILRDTNGEPVSLPPAHGYGRSGRLPTKAPPSMRAGSSGGYEPLRGARHEYESQSYPLPRAMTSAFDANIRNSAIGSQMGAGGSNYPTLGEFTRAKIMHEDPRSGGSEHIVPSSEAKEFMVSSGPNINIQGTSYQGVKTQQSSSYHSNPQQNAYHHANAPQSSYPNPNTQQSLYHHHPNAQQNSYLGTSAQQTSYETVNAQHSPYQNLEWQQQSYNQNMNQPPINPQQDVYPNNSDPQGAYYNSNAQQGAYQY